MNRVQKLTKSQNVKNQTWIDIKRIMRLECEEVWQSWTWTWSKFEFSPSDFFKIFSSFTVTPGQIFRILVKRQTLLRVKLRQFVKLHQIWSVQLCQTATNLESEILRHNFSYLSSKSELVTDWVLMKAISLNLVINKHFSCNFLFLIIFEWTVMRFNYLKLGISNRYCS